MLNKEVCKKCRSHHDFRWQPEAWSERDDVMWDGGLWNETVITGRIVYCWRYKGQALTVGALGVDDPVPDWCPYVVEHAVSQEC